MSQDTQIQTTPPAGRTTVQWAAGAITAGIIGSILFSGKGILVKEGMALGADPLQMLSLRMLYAAPIFAGLLVWALARKPVARTDLAKAAGLGLLGFWISPFLNFYGLRTVSASLERILIYACPALVLFFAFVLGRERLSRKGVLALSVSYVGVAVSLLGRDSGRGSADPSGAAIILVGCAIYAVFVVLSVRMQQKIGVTAFTSTAMLASACAVTLQTLVTSGTGTLLRPPQGVIPIALALAWGATVLPSYLVAFCLKSLGAARSSMAQMVGPVFTPAAAAYFLGERMSIPQMGGFALVLAGGVLLGTAKE